jgi:catechol 2,3-dioxygenase-like lactoylglutathione lyase family enzyme
VKVRWSSSLLRSLLWVAALVCSTHAVASMTPNPKTFAYAIVSVADIDQALGLWRDQMGMEIVVRRKGPDTALAKSWGIAPEEISDQALLRTPGAKEGGLHLIRFRQPGKAVREGAATTDLVPKSLDIWTRDIHESYDALQKAGFKFRSPVQQLSKNLYEVHMFGPDELNIVLLGAPGGAKRNFSAKGFDAVPMLIVISPDNVREAEFFTSLLGAEQVSNSQFKGPAIEAAVGLPPGAGLDIRIMGDRQADLGRIEIVQYSGAPQRNLYPLAKPPARGLLAATYFVPDLDAFLKRGAAFGIEDIGEVEGVYGAGRMATVTTPAGLRVNLFSPR